MVDSLVDGREGDNEGLVRVDAESFAGIARGLSPLYRPILQI